MPFLQSITSLFSRPQRGDSFALPTTQYENPVPNGSPGPSRRGSYQPTSAGGQDAYLTSSTGPAGRYPPLSHTFHRLRTALVDTFPELIDSINDPATAEALADFEQQLGGPLPPPVRESFLCADGQDLDTATTGGLFYGLYLLPLEEVFNEWLFWRQVEQDPRTGANPAVLATMASIPPQWVKSQYTCAGWLPLISDRSGNYIGVDLDPGPGGAWGQTIIFGRDFDRKCVLFRGEGEGGWAKWLASFVDEVESGEGWEATAGSSDDEEQLGYNSYSSADVYGEGGQGLRLAGEYRGWNVLEAWWDKSVKKWEAIGLGMDVAEIERGLSEARRLNSSMHSAKGKENATEPIDNRESIDLGATYAEQRAAVKESLHLSIGGRTTPAEGDALLPPPSPESVPRILHSQHNTVSSPALISPIVSSPLRSTPATDHPLKSSDLLSPPIRKPTGSNTRRRPPPPAPAMLDLPTRADVQAAEAVAQAETSGLRGGWVMNMDTSAGAANRRAVRGHATTPSMDPASMVDIDLEGGRLETFGTPQMRAEDHARQTLEDKMAQSGIEHRRSGATTPLNRTPSPLSQPLSRTGSTAETTPRESAYVTPSGTPPLGNVSVASAIRRPPPIVDQQRSHSPVTGDSLTGEVIRGVAARRPSAQSNPATSPNPRKDSFTPQRDPQREYSTMSNDSADGLLAQSPITPVNRRDTGLVDEPQSVNDVAGELEEIKL